MGVELEFDKDVDVRSYWDFSLDMLKEYRPINQNRIIALIIVLFSLLIIAGTFIYDYYSIHERQDSSESVCRSNSTWDCGIRTVFPVNNNDTGGKQQTGPQSGTAGLAE